MINNHEDYIKKRDEITKRLAIATHEVEPGEDEAGNFAEAAQAIDALVLEVIGKSTNPISTDNLVNAAIVGANTVRDEQRHIVKGEQS